MTYTEIGPRSRATAEALLEAAKVVGEPVASVRTTIRGYIVPDAVAAYYKRMIAGETAPVEEPAVTVDTVPIKVLPDDSWKNADIEKYAEDNGIDLGGATKKADMLAVITADTKEE